MWVGHLWVLKLKESRQNTEALEDEVLSNEGYEQQEIGTGPRLAGGLGSPAFSSFCLMRWIQLR